MNASPARPLDRVRVIDISLTAAGAWATRLMADAGADVIFVEPRHGGHPLRHVGPFDAAGASIPSTNFLANKRAVALDLGEQRSRRYAIDLMRRAEVVVSSFTADELAARDMTYAGLMKKALILAHVLPGDVPALGVEAHLVGATAYAQIVAALRWRDLHPAEGREIDVTESDALEGFALPSSEVAAAQRERISWRRAANAPDGMEFPGPAYEILGSPAQLERRPPRAGEHTFNVLRTWCNVTDDHLLSLYESGVIGMYEEPEEPEAQS